MLLMSPVVHFWDHAYGLGKCLFIGVNRKSSPDPQNDVIDHEPDISSINKIVARYSGDEYLSFPIWRLIQESLHRKGVSAVFESQRCRPLRQARSQLSQE